jgi:hypothetical protein
MFLLNIVLKIKSNLRLNIILKKDLRKGLIKIYKRNQ